MLTRLLAILITFTLQAGGAFASEPVRSEDPAAPPGAAGALTEEGGEDAAVARETETLLVEAREGDEASRRRALRKLAVRVDQPQVHAGLRELIGDASLDDAVRTDAIRAVALPGQASLVAPLVELLDHERVALRGNAVVTLEYIGSPVAVDALRKRLRREEIPTCRSDLCRAIGRCAAGDKRVRALLLKELRAAEGDERLVGPLMGLAYFKGDRTLARTLEKMLAKLVVPKSMAPMAAWRRARLIGWLLSEIADPRTPRYLEDRVIPRARTSVAMGPGGSVAADWTYDEAVARKIQGDPTAVATVDSVVVPRGGREGDSVASVMAAAMGESLPTMGPLRQGRDMTSFRPKGDHPPVRIVMRGPSR